jgi:hypothetical protein
MFCPGFSRSNMIVGCWMNFFTWTLPRSKLISSPVHPFLMTKQIYRLRSVGSVFISAVSWASPGTMQFCDRVGHVREVVGLVGLGRFRMVSEL